MIQPSDFSGHHHRPKLRRTVLSLKTLSGNACLYDFGCFMILSRSYCLVRCNKQDCKRSGMAKSVCMHRLHVHVMLLFLRQQLQWLGHEQRVELVGLASITIQPMLMTWRRPVCEFADFPFHDRFPKVGVFGIALVGVIFWNIKKAGPMCRLLYIRLLYIRFDISLLM